MHMTLNNNKLYKVIVIVKEIISINIKFSKCMAKNEGIIIV